MLLLTEEYYNDKYEHAGFAQMLGMSIAELNRRISDSEYFNWKLCIPKAYARMETDEQPRLDEVESVDHYEIIIFKQIGTARNRRDCFVLCKFPNTDRYFRIILHMDGGVSYVKEEHKYMLRCTDELDRRIVLGFCMMYSGNLTGYSYSSNPRPNWWMQNNALEYRAKDMPKRLKQGSKGNDFSYTDLEPYEEHTIFRNLAFI